MKNPDTQYLRYQHLMTNQFYNIQANSNGFQDEYMNFDTTSQYGQKYGDSKKMYTIPNHFKLAEIKQKQREEAMRQLTDQLKQKSQGPELDQKQQRLLKPQSITIYQLPQNPAPSAPQPPRPEYYRAIQMNQSVRREVIDSLGGIKDTLKPMQRSLKQHEMRPFDIEPNYKAEMAISKNPDLFRSTMKSARGRN